MEQTSNNASALINMGGGLSNVATALTVDTEINTPTSGTFRALIQSEIVWVTSVAGSVWTIVRGQEGTTAASHADNTFVYAILTKKAMDSIVSFQQEHVELANYRTLDVENSLSLVDDSGSSRVKLSGSLSGETLTRPVLGDWTLDGHSITGTPTLLQQGKSLAVWHPGTSGDANVEVYKTPPATPYAIVARIRPFGLAWNFTSAGLYIGDGTKLERIVFQLNNNQIICDRYTAYNTFSSNPIGVAASMFAQGFWFRIRDDGTNHIMSFSPDGQNWLVYQTQARAVFLSSTQTRVGFALNGNTGTNNTGRIAVMLIDTVHFTA